MWGWLFDMISESSEFILYYAHNINFFPKEQILCLKLLADNEGIHSARSNISDTVTYPTSINSLSFSSYFFAQALKIIQMPYTS